MSNISKNGAPNSKTVGNVGDIWTDLNTGTKYKLVNIHTFESYSGIETTYDWDVINEDKNTVIDELADARVDKDGNTHDNVGEHIRTVTSQLSSEISNTQKQNDEQQEQIDTLNQGGLNLKEDFIGEQVNEWLDKHPEATTTVQDGSLTESKFSDELKIHTIKDYVTPQMFGAKGDGAADDTTPLIDVIIYANANNCSIKFPNGKYRVTQKLPDITSGIGIYGADGNNENVQIIDDRESTTEYLLTITAVNFNIENIQFIAQNNVNGIFLAPNCGWIGCINHCKFHSYATMLYLDRSNDIRVNDTQFISGKKTNANGEIAYSVVLNNTNATNFNDCHFEHSSYFLKVYICWLCRFDGCKFEQSAWQIELGESPIIITHTGDRKGGVIFTNSYFITASIEQYKTSLGLTNYDGIPYFITSTNVKAIGTKFIGCQFSVGNSFAYTGISVNDRQGKFLCAYNSQISCCRFNQASFNIPSIMITNSLFIDNDVTIDLTDNDATANEFIIKNNNSFNCEGNTLYMHSAGKEIIPKLFDSDELYSLFDFGEKHETIIAPKIFDIHKKNEYMYNNLNQRYCLFIPISAQTGGKLVIPVPTKSYEQSALIVYGNIIIACVFNSNANAVGKITSGYTGAITNKDTLTITNTSGDFTGIWHGFAIISTAVN